MPLTFMKKREIVFLPLIILFLLANIAFLTSANSQDQGITVSVVPAAAVLEIVSPTNTTYTEGDYILLDYNEEFIDTVWYNLDNGTNTTINSSFYFQTSVGTHTLYLYGNQSNGTVLSDNVTFMVEEAARGGRTIPKKEVIVEEEITVEDKIALFIRQGETKEVKLLIKNNNDKATKIKIADKNLEDLLAQISDIEFYLEPGKAKEITITFSADKDKIPDLYMEKITIFADSLQKEITFYVEVESKDPLFDVSVEIPEKPAIFYPEDTLSAEITFYNLGKEGETEVDIDYLIKNPEGDIVFGEKQTLVIGKSLSFIKKIDIPSDIEAGDYLFYVRVTYDSKTASASKWFRVLPVSILPKNIQKMLDGIREDGPYLAMAIFTFMMMFIGFTAFQILAAKYGWFGARRAYCKAGKKPAAGKKYAATRKSKQQSYKKRVKRNLKRIKK